MSDAAPPSGDAGTMAFVQYLLPPLESGTFTVTVTQQVSVDVAGTNELLQSFQSSQTFVVAGERYALAPADIDSVFPPAGNQGEFGNTLPHVVLTAPTLPWQRSPGASPAALVAGQPVASWLAVLLFDQNDPPPAPQQVTIHDLVATATTYFPPRVAEDGENTTDPVTVIDIPVSLFNAIAPSRADLDWIAHVRAVDPAAKSGTATPTVDYAVVFGNRLPLPGNTATAHLVSLEDFGPVLPADDGTPSAAMPAGTTTVRVVTLKSWSFTAFDLQQSFTGMLTSLDVSPPALQLPFDGLKKSSDQTADTAVQNAFGMGYTALPHTLRDGSRTVSWYRGPLLPLGTTVTASTPTTSADQWLRYDPKTGMFDVSYASAWQVGRLLALHDRAFASALYRWKLTQTQAAVSAVEQGIIDQALPPVVQDSLSAAPSRLSVGGARNARLATAVKVLVGPSAAAIRATAGKGAE